MMDWDVVMPENMIEAWITEYDYENRVSVHSERFAFTEFCRGTSRIWSS